MQRVFFRTLFEISSGPSALSGASRLTASRICRIVICGVYWTSCGYVASRMSLRSAGGGLGKNAFWSATTFCSFVAASSSRVGMKVGIGVSVIYRLIWNMDFRSALLTYSLHLPVMDLSISREYSFALAFHISLSTGCLVRPNIFRSLFASRRRLERRSFHYRLLWGVGFFRGVVSSTALLMAWTSCSAKLSISVHFTAFLLINVILGRQRSSLAMSSPQSVLT